ncbi:MAG TPA: diguanylate cyclase [Candidatus Aminicenantes bacterium]|nr:diguanylate cyclase [Candidatus Aminicenantes bacterium]
MARSESDFPLVVPRANLFFILRSIFISACFLSLIPQPLCADSPEELLDQAARSLPHDPASARQVAQSVLDQAEAGRRSDLRARALYLLGDAALADHDYLKAMEYLRRSREAFAITGDRKQEARCLRRLGDAHYYIANHDVAMEHYLAGLRIFRELVAKQDEPELRLGVGHLLATVGNVCRADRSLPQALDYYRQALAVYEKEGFTQGLAGVRANLASIHQQSGQMEAALAENLAGLEIARGLDDPYLLTILLTNAGASATYLDRPQEARAFLNESMTISRARNRRRGILFNLVKLGELEIRQKNWSKAVDFLREAVDLAKELNDRSVRVEALERLADSLSGSDQPGAALNTYKQAGLLRSELMDEARNKRIQELRLIYETERREQELAIMKKQARDRTRLNRLLGLVAALLALLVLVLVSLARLKMRSAAVLKAKNAELEKVFQQVSALSLTDDLTGLANRRSIREKIDAEQIRSKRTGQNYALILADVDHFKLCNDAHGHDVGDQLLIGLSRLFQHVLRAQDFVGRWGGEEFMFLLPETDLEGARVLAEKIRRTVEEKVTTIAGGVTRVTLTLGLTVYRPGESAEAVMLRADAALYAGKNAGRNRVFVLE